MPKGKILIIDDDGDVLYTTRMVLKNHFKEVYTERDPTLISGILAKEQFDVILLDMNFSPGTTSGKEGLHWLKTIKSLDPGAHVIICTAYGDIPLAVTAMKEGASEFLVKPWEKEKLLATVNAIFQLSQKEKETQLFRSRQAVQNSSFSSSLDQIISGSKAMESIMHTIKKVAPTDANVLILGENGTGKELMAKALHLHSQRKDEAFIKVDLGSISESLFESELFGHIKGAFTDAKDDRAGRFEIATGGTLFLDEIANLSLPMQAKLLSVLQNREVVRIGSNKAIPIDIRLIAATNADLEEQVKAGKFRQDLLYRLNTVEIQLPPLRERTEDIPLIARHYLDLYSKKYQKGRLQFTNDALKALQKHQWPGNIRELQHCIERAVILAENSKVEQEDLVLKASTHSLKSSENLNMEEVEMAAIQMAIQKHQGNLTKAAQELGYGRSTLYRKIEKYGL
jgi:two-component system, NtrC family, response regulator HydG